VDDAIAERTSIGALTSLQRAWNANKFSFQDIGGNANDRIPVPAHVHKRDMRREIRIREKASFFDISAFRIFKTRFNSVLQEEVDCGLRIRIPGPLSHE